MVATLGPAVQMRHVIKCGVMYGESWTGLVDALPVCVFGVIADPVNPDVGHPWLLGTEDIKRVTTRFLKQSRLMVAEMSARYPILTCMVDERNALHIRWLKWLGFREISRTPEYGVGKLPFIQFQKTA